MSRLLHIIDGSGYIYRAYYAIKSLTTASGEVTNASFGFAQMIQKVLDEDRPEYLAIVFDTGEPTFRRDIYPLYKANRSAPPDDLPGQIPRIHEVTDSYRIAKFAVPGFEADDVIATLVRRAREAGFEVRLITGDKDLMQLVSPEVTVWEPMRETRYNPKSVAEKWGVSPGKLLDLLALSGDSSDNIPGVKGVGPKTAAKLIEEHGDVEGIIAAALAGKIKGKTGERIAESVDDLRLSARLVRLEDHVPVEISIEGLRFEGPDLERQRVLFAELEFTRLLKKVEDATPAEAPVEVAPLGPARYEVLTDCKALAARLAKAELIGLSMEWATPQMVDTAILGVGIADGPGRAVYVPGRSLDLEALRPVLEDRRIGKSCSSAKVWYALCQRHGIRLAGVKFDPSLGSYLVDAEDRYDQSSAIRHEADDGPHGSGDVARKFLGAKTIARSAVLGRGRERLPFESLPDGDVAAFVAERADVSLRVVEPLRARLRELDLEAVLTDLELPLVPVLAAIELAGIRVDVAMLEAMQERFAAELARLEERCYALAGHPFNLGSTPQLRKVLYEELELKILKRTKTGPSTDQSVLEELAAFHELPQAILDYRQISKLQSTYVEALPKQVSAKTGRIHTVLSQTVAATGRLSASDPNLQNIPIRTELGRALRKAFIPAEGARLISVDYSQIELRVLAHFSEEPVLVAAFAEGDDVHRRTASVLFGVALDEVSFEQRTQAKTVNFGVLYGMGPVRLARDLGIPRRTASQFIDDYFARQPGVKKYWDDTLAFAREHQYVRTLFGRRRWVRELDSKNRGIRAAAERVAVNTPIQGSAADLIKLAMIRVHARLLEEHPRARLILQVHDELLVEAPHAEAEAVAALVKTEMEHAYPLNVPLVASAHVGGDWDEAH